MRSARTFATTSDPDFRDRQEQGGDACVDVSAPISLQVRAGLGPAAVHGRSSCWSSRDEYFRDYHAPSHPRDEPRADVIHTANTLIAKACDLDLSEWR